MKKKKKAKARKIMKRRRKDPASYPLWKMTDDLSDVIGHQDAIEYAMLRFTLG